MTKVKQMFLLLLTRTTVCCIFVTKDVIQMKKVLVNYGGIALFYIIIVFGALYLCTSNSTTKNSSPSFGISAGSQK